MWKRLLFNLKANWYLFVIWLVFNAADRINSVVLINLGAKEMNLFYKHVTMAVKMPIAFVIAIILFAVPWKKAILTFQIVNAFFACLVLWESWLIYRLIFFGWK